MHEGRKNVVFSKGEEVLDRMMASDFVEIVVGEREGKVVATLTIYFLPRVRLGGMQVVFEDILVTKELRGKGIGRDCGINFWLRVYPDSTITRLSSCS